MECTVVVLVVVVTMRHLLNCIFLALTLEGSFFLSVSHACCSSVCVHSTTSMLCTGCERVVSCGQPVRCVACQD